jgi:hypothetical protein
MAQLTAWGDESITPTKLNERTVMWGTTAQRPATNHPVDSWFFTTDTGILYQNTGTFATPVWTLRAESVQTGLVLALG